MQYSGNKIDPELIPWNIRIWTEIFGVEWTYDKPDDFDLVPWNVRHWVNIYWVVGTYNSAVVNNLVINYQWPPTVAIHDDDNCSMVDRKNEVWFHDDSAKTYIDVFGETSIAILDSTGNKHKLTRATYGRIDKTTYEYTLIDTADVGWDVSNTGNNPRLVTTGGNTYFTTQVSWGVWDNLRIRDGDTIAQTTLWSSSRASINSTTPYTSLNSSITLDTVIRYEEYGFDASYVETTGACSASLIGQMKVSFL